SYAGIAGELCRLWRSLLLGTCAEEAARLDDTTYRRNRLKCQDKVSASADGTTYGGFVRGSVPFLFGACYARHSQANDSELNMPVAEIATGYGALKAAYEMAKGLKDIHDRVTLNAAIIELQEKILSAQEAASSAKDQLRELQAKVEAFEDWKAIAARYDLKDYGGSTFAYELNANWDHQEPIHRACPKCFENRKRSILQFDYKDSSKRDHYKCHGCGSGFEFGVAVPYEAPSRTTTRSSWMA
ncbi:hypothetical protein, partial [Mesorhizobium sp. M1A.F.Ca.IN.022.07.1.1]|uniref:hypothetical protein n=1 Tax=Mesorhizobium sp. M1A.F.Ca.IN.022.07.1.1 TaxID=2496767 RepID=UPI0019D069E8